jgi:hypothetical protein
LHPLNAFIYIKQFQPSGLTLRRFPLFDARSRSLNLYRAWSASPRMNNALRRAQQKAMMPWTHYFQTPKNLAFFCGRI